MSPAGAAGPPSEGEPARAARLFAEGKAATEDGRPALAARRLRAALRAAGEADPAVRGRILVTLAWAEAERGHVDQGFHLLDEAEPLLPPPTRAVLHAQRAVLLRRNGHNERALPEFDSAIAGLPEHEAPLDLVKVLNNRALLHRDAGRVGACRDDLTRALRIAHRHDFALLAALIRVNLGCLDVLAGDLPAALGAFGAARPEYERVAPGRLSHLAVERSRALVAAGLFREADRELAAAIAQARAQSQDHTLADALQVRAEAALLAARPIAAVTWATEARTLFLRRGNRRTAALAALLALRGAASALPLTPAGPSRTARGVVSRGRRLARELTSLGLPEDARVAALVTARALLPRSPRAAARLIEDHGPPGRLDRLDTRLLWRLVNAELALATGRPAAAGRHLTAGMGALHRHRARFGCLDLQTGASVHGRDLAATGVAAALASGSAAALHRWSERARAQALLLPPVHPPGDPREASVLEELRQTRHTLRTAELAGTPTTALRGRVETLQRSLREHTWSTRPGTTTGVPPTASLTAVRAALGDAVLIAYVRCRDTLRALVVTSSQTSIVPLGDWSLAEEAVLRLRADLDTAAGRALPARLAKALEAATTRDAQALQAAVLDPLTPRLGDRDLILVPTGLLTTAPWSLLPACRGRPVTVTPSATTWLAGRTRPARSTGPAGRTQPARPEGPVPCASLGRAGRTQPARPEGPVPCASLGRAGRTRPAHSTGPAPYASVAGRTRPAHPDAPAPHASFGGRVVVAAGPDLRRGEDEAREIASLRPGSVLLLGESATPAGVLQALDGAALAHLAAHGRHEAENALFSTLELAGGPLLGYDLQRLRQPPAVVVLSSCELGLSEIRPGDETFGLASALLAAGTTTVVASVARVADDIAREVMVRFHRALTEGHPPAAALAAAGPGTSFLCLGG
ncbi:hypothetical protein GCM10010167_64520 [Paractinoplanes deccanensis]|uniref:CHAT domain-containing protein n=2 Tax=Paractinoplanes deccanensis TaxID=113561 RepID=UPI0031D73D13